MDPLTRFKLATTLGSTSVRKFAPTVGLSHTAIAKLLTGRLSSRSTRMRNALQVIGAFEREQFSRAGIQINRRAA